MIGSYMIAKLAIDVASIKTAIDTALNAQATDITMIKDNLLAHRKQAQEDKEAVAQKLKQSEDRTSSLHKFQPIPHRARSERTNFCAKLEHI